MSETLTWSAPIETEKIKTHHAKIVVECTTGKPYYSIEWFDTVKQEYYLGYSSYCIDNVLGWLKEYFEIVEAPKTNADRIRAMSYEELVKLFGHNSICDYVQDHSGIQSEGVIDAGYTGSICVKLYNHGPKAVEIKKGQKISQIVLLPIITPDLELVDELEETERGNGGFGSTGKF